MSTEIPDVAEHLIFPKNIKTFRVSVTDNITYSSHFDAMYWVYDYDNLVVWEITKLKPKSIFNIALNRLGIYPVYTFRPLFFIPDISLLEPLNNPIEPAEHLTFLIWIRDLNKKDVAKERRKTDGHTMVASGIKDLEKALFTRYIDCSKYNVDVSKFDETMVFQKDKGLIELSQSVGQKKTMIWTLKE